MKSQTRNGSWIKPAGHPGLIGTVNLLASGFVWWTISCLSIFLFFSGLSALPVAGTGLVFLVAWFYFQWGINTVERNRAESIYSLGYPKPQMPQREPGFTEWVKWLGRAVTSAVFWRGTAHHFLKSFTGAVLGGLSFLALAFAIVFFGIAVSDTISQEVVFDNVDRPLRFVLAVVLTVFTVVILWYSAMLDRAIDKLLLAPSKADTLTEEVTALDDARQGAVGAAETERARLERDLHDGVQPMLVAQSMKIGMAKAKLETDPEGARTLIAEAHEDSKQAVAELRRLVRGLQPAVLGDRGLDAALSGLAAQSVVPVDLTVNLPGRVDRDIESVAYFVVAEALTNINKHAHATRATVRVGMTADLSRLQIEVSDNGRGGAHLPVHGNSGLAGLRDRVRAVRGSWEFSSPEDGPTELKVEVPCAF
ncbi:sensor histidine kinase [Brevibacterium ravenspurgense]|uniref:sensor histidine kinase n=1 Tax=Brevibacterium ravenspurgense TaxID=479117 RepID=UPI001EF2A86A|nr:sensor histidine kinase [Brevibacterium ravenspurgense]MCG7301317.1 sensor histidine kinase [Brevibacterium ravenspurgense]